MYDFDTFVPHAAAPSEKWAMAAETGCPADVVPLTVADMEFPAAPVIVDAVREVAQLGYWGYAHADDDFKAAITGWMQRRHSWQPEAGWMVHTSGVVQALYAAVRTFTQPGQGVLIQPPAYPPFYSAVQDTGRNLVENPLRLNGRGEYEIDFDDLAEKLPRANMMIFCNPHNPVGRVWTQEEVEMVSRLCFEYGVPVYSDEIHCDFVYPPHSHYSMGRLPGEHLKNCLIGTSASKTFSLAGLGASTTFVPDYDMRRHLQHRLEQDGYGFNSTFGVVATKAAYRAAEDWLDELLVYLQGNYAFIKDFIAQNLPGLMLHDLQGTYLAWIDFSGWKLSPDERKEFLCRDAQLFLNDGRMFGTGGAGFCRMNLACPRSVLDAAMDRLLIAAKERGLV